MPGTDVSIEENAEESAFFTDGGSGDSLSPTCAEAPHDEVPPVPAERAAFQARLKTIVASVVGGVSLLAAFAVVKTITKERHQSAMHDPTTYDATVGMQDPTITKMAPVGPHLVNPPSPGQIDSPPEIVEPARSIAARAPLPVDRREPVVTALDARQLLIAGRLRAAIVAARAALAADSGDAETYLLLGAALQDTGHWNDAMTVFSTCVQSAKHGPIADCRALARR